MSVTLTVKSLEKKDWFKVVKVFFYAAVSLGLAWLPVHFAHNTAYLALAAPINAALVALKQTIAKEEQSALGSLPASQQADVQAGINAVDQTITPTPPVEPAAPSTPPVGQV